MPKLTQSSYSPTEFARFEKAARLTQKANGWNNQMLIYHVLGSMVGAASDNTRSMSEDVKAYTGIMDFFQILKERFVTAAHATVARSNFEQAIQMPNETIRAYHSRLHTLWLDSFAREDEPWLFNPAIPVQSPHLLSEPGLRNDRLIKRFKTGLHDESLKRYLDFYAAQTRTEYRHYNLLLQDIIHYVDIVKQSQVEAIQNRLMLKLLRNKKSMEDASLTGEFSTRNAGNAFALRAQPQRKKKLNRKVIKQKPRVVPKTRRIHAQLGPHDREEAEPRPPLAYCQYHNSDKHTDRDCREQKKKRESGRAVQTQNNQYKGNGKAQKSKKDLKCFKCSKKGHYARDCRVKEPRNGEVAYLESFYREESEE